MKYFHRILLFLKAWTKKLSSWSSGFDVALSLSKNTLSILENFSEIKILARGANFFSLFWKFEDRTQNVFFFSSVTGPLTSPFTTLDSRESSYRSLLLKSALKSKLGFRIILNENYFGMWALLKKFFEFFEHKVSRLRSRRRNGHVCCFRRENRLGLTCIRPPRGENL